MTIFDSIYHDVLEPTYKHALKPVYRKVIKPAAKPVYKEAKKIGKRLGHGVEVVADDVQKIGEGITTKAGQVVDVGIKAGDRATDLLDPKNILMIGILAIVVLKNMPK